jgi:glucose/arabinose dehydrogenase
MALWYVKTGKKSIFRILNLFILAYLSPKNLDPRRRFANGLSERQDLVERTRTPDVLFQSHSAVLGMQFYRGKQFPSYYQNGAFAAFHGSWNRHTSVGFNIIFIPFGKDFRPKGYYEEFLKGFLTDSKGPKAFARPVGILEMKDGSLLISEDGNGRLYRIEYLSKQSKLESMFSNARTIRIDMNLFIVLVLWKFFS